MRKTLLITGVIVVMITLGFFLYSLLLPTETRTPLSEEEGEKVRFTELTQDEVGDVFISGLSDEALESLEILEIERTAYPERYTNHYNISVSDERDEVVTFLENEGFTSHESRENVFVKAEEEVDLEAEILESEEYITISLIERLLSVEIFVE